MDFNLGRDALGANGRLGKLYMFSLGALTAAIAIVTLATAATAQSVSRVRVTGGEIQGAVVDGVVAFKGIPVAAPPVGDLRWRPPHPVQPGRACARPRISGLTACRALLGRPRWPRPARPPRLARPKIASI